MVNEARQDIDRPEAGYHAEHNEICSLFVLRTMLDAEISSERLDRFLWPLLDSRNRNHPEITWSMVNAVAAGARVRTRPGALKPTSMKLSTTAGRASVCWRPSRRKFSRTAPSRSSRATTAPTSHLIARSILTAVASMAASTATRDRAIATSGIPQVSISKPNSTPSPMLRRC